LNLHLSYIWLNYWQLNALSRGVNHPLAALDLKIRHLPAINHSAMSLILKIATCTMMYGTFAYVAAFFEALHGAEMTFNTLAETCGFKKKKLFK
jgi:hypothetical protein